LFDRFHAGGKGNFHRLFCYFLTVTDSLARSNHEHTLPSRADFFTASEDPVLGEVFLKICDLPRS
jgi:hypothetical protein